MVKPVANQDIKIHITVILAVLALSSVGVMLLFEESRYSYEAKMSVAESDEIRFREKTLDFGNLPLGSSSKAYIEIENSGSLKMKVSLSAKGGISRFLTFNKTFIIYPNEIARIPIIANAKESGSYNGELVVTIKMPKIGLMESLLKWA